ncbi:MAG: hypothetical protein AAFN30_20600 [Actinomycetota bacterium]
MESTSDCRESPADPATRTPSDDLALLERAASVVNTDQYLDFGPWWYAPMLATSIGGLSLFGPAVDGDWKAVTALVAVGAGAVVSVHDYRRRTVRLRPSIRGAVYVTGMVVLIWMLVATWGTALSALGWERFVPGYAIAAWVLTSLLLLGVRATLLRARRRQPPLL